MADSRRNTGDIRDTSKIYLLLFTAFALFILNDTIRAMLSKSAVNMKFNLVFIMAGIATIAYLFYKENIDLRMIVLGLAIAGLAFLAIQSGSGKLSHNAKALATIFMPMLIIGFRIPEVDFNPFLRIFIRGFNIICILAVALGLVDYFTEFGITNFFIDYRLFDNEVSSMIRSAQTLGIYRLYSFIGHPLVTAWYLLIFYTLNVLYNRYYKPLLNDYFVIIVTFTGLLLCGSRTALIAALLMLIFLNNSKNKFAFISFVTALGAGLFSTSLFKENLLQRFVLYYEAGDISQGRNQAFYYVWHGYAKMPAWFTGGGLDSSYQITTRWGFIKSFEYPIIMLAYDLGIVAVILIYAALLLIPVYIFIKNRSYRILAFFLLIFIYMNGFTALADYSDYMGQFCFITMILLNLSSIIHKKTEGAILL